MRQKKGDRSAGAVTSTRGEPSSLSQPRLWAGPRIPGPPGPPSSGAPTPVEAGTLPPLTSASPLPTHHGDTTQCPGGPRAGRPCSSRADAPLAYWLGGRGRVGGGSARGRRKEGRGGEGGGSGVMRDSGGVPGRAGRRPGVRCEQQVEHGHAARARNHDQPRGVGPSRAGTEQRCPWERIARGAVSGWSAAPGHRTAQRRVLAHARGGWGGAEAGGAARSAPLSDAGPPRCSCPRKGTGTGDGGHTVSR